jgi:hypothetical protein
MVAQSVVRHHRLSYPGTASVAIHPPIMEALSLNNPPPKVAGLQPKQYGPFIFNFQTSIKPFFLL